MFDSETITEGWRAQDFFTDRDDVSRLYIGCLNSDPPPSTIIYFHGAGGNGKSLLLERLRSRLTKRLDYVAWAQIRDLPDPECVARVSAAAEGNIPIGRLDFDRDPHDGFSALLKLRRDLSGSTIHFPLFDFAVITYLHKSKQLTDERIKSLFPSDEVAALFEIAQLVQELPFASIAAAVLNLTDKHLGRWFHRFRLRRQLDQTDVESILKMDHESELILELPSLFGRDLVASLGDSESLTQRAVLFFDTHEAIWGNLLDLSDYEYFARDEWLHRLVASIEEKSGVVIVVAGRDAPRWPSAPRIRIPAAHIDLHLIGDLTDRDANRFLELAGVDDSGLRDQLCNDSRVEIDRVHPLSLGLGADLAIAARRKGKELKSSDLLLSTSEIGEGHQAVINRFLKYVGKEMEKTIVLLSASGSFDWNTYEYLGRECRYSCTGTGFDVLTSYSFVRRVVENGTERFRMHDLLRRYCRDQKAEPVRKADLTLEQYYAELLASPNLEVGELRRCERERIYHAWQVNSERTALDVDLLFDEYMSRYRYDYCQDLIQAISVEAAKNADDRAWLGYFGTRLAFGQKKYELAADLFASDESSNGKSPALAINLLMLSSPMLIRAGKRDEAEQKVHAAKASLSELRKTYEVQKWVSRKSGYIDLELAHIYWRSGLLGRAAESFEAALEGHGIDDAGIQIHTQNELGGVYLSMGRPSDAIIHFKSSIAVAEANSDEHLSLLAQTWLTRGLLGNEEIEAGQNCLRMVISKTNEYPGLAAWAQELLGESLLQTPSLSACEEAVRLFHNSMGTWLSMGSEGGAFKSRVKECRALHRAGKAAEIPDLSEDAERLDRRNAAPDSMSWWLTVKGHCILEAYFNNNEAERDSLEIVFRTYLDALEVSLRENLLLLDGIMGDIAWNLERAFRVQKASGIQALASSLLASWISVGAESKSLAERELHMRTEADEWSRPQSSVKEHLESLVSALNAERTSTESSVVEGDAEANWRITDESAE